VVGGGAACIDWAALGAAFVLTVSTAFSSAYTLA
jgi:hypothetical protein